MALITGLVSAGWSDEQIFSELSDPSRSAAAVILKDKYQGTLFSQIRSKTGIARSRVAKHRLEIDNWLGQFLHSIPRRRTASLARTAIALAVIARDSGNRTFTASIRQIAETAGVGTATPKGADTKTVRKSLAKLSELGFISRRIRTSEGGQEPKSMSEITLNVIDTGKYPTIPADNKKNSGGVNCHAYIVGRFTYDEILHPLWEHSGLGLSAFRIWVLLRSRGELTVREIADVLGIARTQVNAILKQRLEEYGMAYQGGESRWGSIDRNLDEAAESLGVLERPNFRRRSFEIQRLRRNQAMSSSLGKRPKTNEENLNGSNWAIGDVHGTSVEE